MNKGQIQILCGIRRRRDFGACQGRSRGCSLNDTRIITYYKRKGLFKIGGKNRSDIILAIFFFYSSILFKSKVFLLYEISSEKCFKICHFFGIRKPMYVFLVLVKDLYTTNQNIISQYIATYEFVLSF